MDATVQVAIIGACVSIVSAAASFYFNKRAERRDHLRQQKRQHYSELLGAISDLACDTVDQVEANARFNRAVNTIVLVAPQSVVTALMAFHDEIRVSNPNRTQEQHDRRLKELVLAIRRSLELPSRDDPDSFVFHLVGKKPA